MAKWMVDNGAIWMIGKMNSKAKQAVDDVDNSVTFGRIMHCLSVRLKSKDF